MYKLKPNEIQMYILYFKSVDLLKFSFENTLLPAIKSAELVDMNDKILTLKCVNSILLSSSLVIDHLARTLKISRKLNCLSQKKDPFIEYISSQDWVIEARNKIQHINDEIRTDGSGPILGSVLWDGEDGSHFLVSLTSPIKIETVPGLIIDTWTGKTTMDLAYVHNERYLNIKNCYSGAIKFHEYVKSVVEFKDENGVNIDILSHFLSLKMKFTL